MYDTNESVNLEIETPEEPERSAILEGTQDLASVKMGEVVNKQEEYDLVASLLEAAEFKNNESLIKEVHIKRNGIFYFMLHISPVSDKEVSLARKKATTRKKKGEPEFSSSTFNSWLIYLSTIEEDRAKIWGNPAVKSKYGLGLPVEAIDVLLTAGEKIDLADLVYGISGMQDDQNTLEDPEEEAKNL